MGNGNLNHLKNMAPKDVQTKPRKNALQGGMTRAREIVCNPREVLTAGTRLSRNIIGAADKANATAPNKNDL
jgi:hypothetical protein